MHISSGIKDKYRDKIVQLLHAELLPGEQPRMLVAINRMRRQADYLAVTDHRVLTWLGPGFGLAGELVDDVDGHAITDASVNDRVGTFKEGTTSLETATGPLPLGTVLRTTAEELRDLEGALRALIGAPPTDEMRAQRRAQQSAEVDASAALAIIPAESQRVVAKEAQAAEDAAREARTVEQQAAKDARAVEKQASKDARAAKKEAAEEARAAAEAAVIGGAQIFGRVTKPMVRTISELSSGGERPWLIIVSWGEGALVAYEDRAAIIKVGAWTAWMAGALGGGRVTTFYFSDITGIEYNSQMVNGVLEILTPSYQGTANKDFWRGSLSSRNANANDPHTLSNTLPLTKGDYRAALPGLKELRERIARSKQTTVIVSTPAPVSRAASAADELSRLAELHASGALTDAEYTTAKAAVIARM